MAKIKIASSRRSEQTREEYDENNKIYWSQIGRRRRRRDDPSPSSPMGKGKIAETRDDASWKGGSKKRKRRRRRREVNDDVLEEILVRLPVKSLIRFETVSKHWTSIITSKYLKDRYMLHQKNQEPKFLCLYDDDWYNKPNIALNTMRLEWSPASCRLEEEEEYHTSDEDPEIALVDEQDVGIVSKSVDGLFCLHASMDLPKQIKVINPATRWSYKLPLSSIQFKCISDNNDSEFPLPGFGKDYVTGTYKIVWLHNIKNYNNTLSCEVFDFRVKKWRHVIPPPPHHRLKDNKAPIFANGWLYWFSKDKTNLIAFDLHKEMFRVIPNPITESSSVEIEMQMGSIDDDRRLLWISETNGDCMQHVWRLTNHNTGGALLKMDKMFSIDLNKITSTWFHDPRLHSPLFKLEAISKNGNNVMLSKRNHNLLLFQPALNSSTFHIFSFSPLPRPCGSALVPFFPSLVSPF